MFSVYLAGPWANRDEVRQAREQLQRAGIQVNAQWLDVEMKEGAGDTAESQAAAGYDMAAEAKRDLDDIDDSDMIVVMNLQKSEGKAVEQGLALERGMPVVVVGRRTNVFQYLPQVTVVETLEEAIPFVKGYAAGKDWTDAA